MKNYRALSVLLAVALLLGLCACGGTAASSTPADSNPAPVSAEAPENEPVTLPELGSEQPVDTESVAESVPAEEAEPAITIDYPIPDGDVFSMISITRRNSIEALGDNSYTATPVYEKFAEATGCGLDVSMLGEATANEKINIMMASGDLPDIFNMTVSQYDSNLMGAVSDGILLDMAPLLEENAPDYNAFLNADTELHDSAYNADGTLCQFVGSNVPVVTKGLLIRQDWLDKLNMQAPTTFDELTQVLEAFKNEMGATMPLLTNFDCETGLTPFFNVNFAGFRSVGYQLTAPDSGEVVCTYASEGFINYLNYLHELNQKGILTEDFMSTGREYGNWESSYYSGAAGVWADNCKELDPAVRANGADPDWKISAFALTGEETSHVSEKTVRSMQGNNFITTACSNPEAAMKMFNYCYTDDGIDLVLYGVKDLSYTGEGDEIQFTDVMTNNENGWSLSTATFWYTAAQWLPTAQQTHYLELLYCKESMEACNYWTEAYGDTAMLLPSGCTLTPEETTEFSNLASDVLTLFTENASRVVIGDLTEDGYRDIIEQANGMGLARMTEIYQAAYDRYLAA